MAHGFIYNICLVSDAGSRRAQLTADELYDYK